MSIFSRYHNPFEAYFRVKRGWWWNVGLRIFQKKFRKKILWPNSFYQILITFPLCFFLFWFILGGLRRVETHFFEIFDFFTNFLNLVMHIRGPLSFRLDIFAFLLKSFNMPPTLGGQMIDTLPTNYLLSRSCLTKAYYRMI